MKPEPLIAFRADASRAIGLGHIRRSLSLADAARRAGSKTTFVARDLGLNVAAMIRGAGHSFSLLPAPDGCEIRRDTPHAVWAGVDWERDAEETVQQLGGANVDWLVVDHYAFDAGWHRAVREALGCRIAVIDDLGDRRLDADLLIDHNWAASHRDKYAAANLGAARILGGPRYALLGPAYADVSPIEVAEEVESIGVFLGGVDEADATSLVLDALDRAPFEGNVEVVATSAFAQLDDLRHRCADRPRTTLSLDLPDLAGFFARHDVQIGAGGGATWERCRLGVPSVVLMVASNQEQGIRALAVEGCVTAVEMSGNLSPRLAEAIATLIGSIELRQRYARCSVNLVDGRGSVRVALAMLGETMSVRPLQRSESAVIHEWRNAPVTRAASGDPRAISFDEHDEWVARALQNPDRHLLMGHVGEIPVGVVRFDRVSSSSFEISIYLDAALHGLGLGPRLLAAGEDWLVNWAGKAVSVVGEVLPSNAPSRAIFEMAGYNLAGSRIEKRLA